MAITQGGRRASLIHTRIVHFGLLLSLSLAFFSLVRDNPFWHPSDFFRLNDAMDIRSSWREVFSADPLQPLVKLVFYLEYRLFGLTAWKYYLFNILVHSINAYVVSVLVFTLLRDRLIAVLSSVLFVCAVGNYGKAVMVVSGISDLLITLVTLLTLLFYFKNELEKGGYVLTRWFVATTLCLILSLMTKATSFGILGCMLAFNIFFRPETHKPILSRSFLVITVIALVTLGAKILLQPQVSMPDDLTPSVFNFLRNYGSYLVRMLFPIHASTLIEHAGPVVQFIYRLATEIRVLTFICIISFTLFGFIFGNRTIRFFLAWTYITVTPFCFFKLPPDWLDIRHLYLVSVGFTMMLASVTVLATRLLYQRKWRRFLPYSVPLIFVFLSQFIITHLDTKYEQIAELEPIRQLEEEVRTRHEGIEPGRRGGQKR